MMNNPKETAKSFNSPSNQNAQRQNPQKQIQKDPRVEHQFFNKMPDINSVENDLMKLLNDFSETRLKKYGKVFVFSEFVLDHII